ncbi:MULTISPECIES: replication-associated recombination protein A [unclassified Mucilaginibacter]|uniref:replication-associated recombination protein A n=1 Tax=unclassified Mucilaginibacter TaxID=2617802 RepID=UPI002AC9A6B0|nr:MULTISPECIES: replication-associated recombination protein A [unclassified Mucilaginibacter]MEB0248817.1 replication-associated recombination protein A [Mucilaginibacter sp. 5B2]MEB0263435.1 replication-associated recombination protein A [Mucilaginibacter sp. 10I4]MEB0280663.1 replication-associated recombination protein A [Mucilaginibacter sp. 10B2]MEB0303117.1 replication-associated recombination protein A [Mucilaginibacter sp. 5C4]WPX24279.1 replication-associated recombination protein A
MINLPPLAERMRPKSLDDYVGQKHLVGPGAVLRKAIESGTLPSMLFWGPPGVGKTTLAYIISQSLYRPFFSLSAINSGVKDVREVIEKASLLKEQGEILPILFIDEIHRFSKSQQDSLLGAVERGIVTLIGATTENPSFEVISALLSRCQVYILQHLAEQDLLDLLEKAQKEDIVLKEKNIVIKEHEALLRLSGGDARKLLNIFELLVNAFDSKKIVLTNEVVLEHVQQNMALYDKTGEQHYDIISAFIKSMRGSDPNGAVYWLARMIVGGEDPLFIARRMLILASEDIGNANPNALLLAQACFESVNKIGMPESQLILSQTVIYLATSPKSNSATTAIGAAIALVRQTGDLPVPLHLRNAPTKLMKNIGYGKNYKYAHSYEGNFADLDFLPEEIRGTKIYTPGNNARENESKEKLKKLWGDRYKY